MFKTTNKQILWLFLEKWERFILFGLFTTVRRIFICSKYWHDVWHLHRKIFNTSYPAYNLVYLVLWSQPGNERILLNQRNDSQLHHTKLIRPDFQRLIWQLMLLSDNKRLTTLREVITKALKIKSNKTYLNSVNSCLKLSHFYHICFMT